jgi:hypothetical protein
MEDPRYQFKGGEYTSSQLESFLPYARMGKSFEEIKSMITSDPILREHKKDLDETNVMTLLDKYPEGYKGLADNPYSQGSGIGGGKTGYIGVEGVKGADIQDDISRTGGDVESSKLLDAVKRADVAATDGDPFKEMDILIDAGVQKVVNFRDREGNPAGYRVTYKDQQSGGEYRSNAIKAMMGTYTEDPLGIFSGNKKREPQGSYGSAGFGQNRLIMQHY